MKILVEYCWGATTKYKRSLCVSLVMAILSLNEDAVSISSL